jgi:hypothetical protein
VEGDRRRYQQHTSQPLPNPTDPPEPHTNPMPVMSTAGFNVATAVDCSTPGDQINAANGMIGSSSSSSGGNGSSSDAKHAQPQQPGSSHGGEEAECDQPGQQAMAGSGSKNQFQQVLDAAAVKEASLRAQALSIAFLSDPAVLLQAEQEAAHAVGQLPVVDGIASVTGEAAAAAAAVTNGGLAGDGNSTDGASSSKVCVFPLR